MSGFQRRVKDPVLAEEADEESVIAEPSKPGPVDRYSFVWMGMIVKRSATEGPEISRKDASRPRGSAVGE